MFRQYKQAIHEKNFETEIQFQKKWWRLHSLSHCLRIFRNAKHGKIVSLENAQFFNAQGDR
jgi:hypothetical protein